MSTDKQKSQVYVYLALVCHNMGDVRSEEMYLERDMQNCIQMFERIMSRH